MVTAVLVLAVVAGCSAEPEPLSPEPSSASPSAPGPSSSSSEAPAAETSPTMVALTAPVLPAAATTADAAGAEAFVRHFWDTVNYAYASGDTAAILAISEAGCQGCVGLKDGVESATSAGGRWVDFAWVTEQYEAAPPDEAALSTVSALMIMQEGAHVIEADGTRQEIAGSQAKAVEVLVEWHEEAWRIYEIEYWDDQP